MIGSSFRFLYGGVPARFPSAFPLSESVARLRARTSRSVFSSLFRESAAGPVRESYVRLQRVIPLFGNSFKPVFIGAFQQTPGGVVLEGRFTIFLMAKIFMTVWLSFVLVWTILAALAVLGAVRDDRVAVVGGSLGLLLPLVGVAFFLIGIGFVRGCWWLSRHDIVYLTSVIEAALSRETSGSGIEGSR